MIKILLDAGHFGYRNQSPVVFEYYESLQMWKLHLLLKQELEKYGFFVATTREEQDKDLDVTSRGRLAKGFHLFLSLHSNAVGGKDGERVNRVDVYYPFDDINQSSHLADALSKAIAKTMGIKEYYIKTRKSDKGNRDYYGVMRGARESGCPLYFILEHSFHTNTKSAKWLLKDSNLEKLAVAQAKVIAKYFKYNIETEEEERVNIAFKVLKKGSKGHQVQNLQTLLNAGCFRGKNGKILTTDGVFGSNTEFALINYQKDNNLTPDGIAGKNTLNKLYLG